MECSINSSQDAALCAEADVPSLLVEVEVLCVEFVEEAGVTDVQLVGGDTDDWAWREKSMGKNIHTNS